MSVVGYKARNHPQQVAVRGARPDVDERTITAADFGVLHKRFEFTIDAAATADNARLPRYWTEHDNALRQSWAGERVWCNPPYSHPNLEQWVIKAHREAGHLPDRYQDWLGSRPRGGANRAELIVMLVPANRTEQGWWQRQVEPYRDSGRGFRTEFLPGRIRFLGPGQTEIGPNERPPFGCCLLIWNGVAR